MSDEGIKKSRKEEFAKFLEEPSREKLRDFLINNLGEFAWQDFKEGWIDFIKLSKHILGLANSGGGCIIFGVKQKDDNTFEPVGLDKLEDKSEIKKTVSKFVPETLDYDILDFSYQESEYDKIKGRKFQVVLVADMPRHIPFVCLEDGDKIRRGAIYVRNKTDTEEANFEDIQNIIDRRIETGYSSRMVSELENDLAQLKVLYGSIFRYYNVFPMSWDELLVSNKRNPKYPEEDFEDFVLRMIELKKKMIESVIKNV